MRKLFLVFVLYSLAAAVIALSSINASAVSFKIIADTSGVKVINVQ